MAVLCEMPNRSTFGGVIPERVNTKTGRKEFPVFGWNLASSRIITIPVVKELSELDRQDAKRQDELTLIPWKGGRSLVLGCDSCKPVSCFLRWQSSHRRWHSGRRWLQEDREILISVFNVHVCARCSWKSRRAHFIDVGLSYGPPNLFSVWRCQGEFIFISTHFHCDSALQFGAFAVDIYRTYSHPAFCFYLPLLTPRNLTTWGVKKIYILTIIIIIKSKFYRIFKR